MLACLRLPVRAAAHAQCLSRTSTHRHHLTPACSSIISRERQTVSAFAPQQPLGFRSSRTSHASSFSTTTSLSAMPICIVVEAEIKEDRMDDFLDMIEKNAVGSRAEPGCIRFDVLQAEDAPNKFFFYEVYEDAAAIAHHKEQPHYAAWGAFKESGGTISSVSKKASGKFMT